MIEYCSTSEFESVLAPGVKYILQKMSHGRRMILNQSASPIYSEMNEIQRRIDVIQEELDRAESEAKISPCSCKHPVDPDPKADCHDVESGRCIKPGCSCRKPQPDREIGDYQKKAELELEMYELVVNKLYPAYVRWAVVSVQGLKIQLPSGSFVDANPDTLLSDGPEFLIPELGEHIQKLMKLSPDEVMGFKPPTTSAAQVAGKISDIVAVPAVEIAHI